MTGSELLTMSEDNIESASGEVANGEAVMCVPYLVVWRGEAASRPKRLEVNLDRPPLVVRAFRGAS